MIEEKAIEKLDSLIVDIKRKGKSEVTEEDKELLITAIRALSKRLPKRPPISLWSKKVRKICPNCKQKAEYLQEYCDKCGQRIDWRYYGN